jgi:hypothetical protein
MAGLEIFNFWRLCKEHLLILSAIFLFKLKGLWQYIPQPARRCAMAVFATKRPGRLRHPFGDARHAINDEALEKIDIRSRPIKFEQLERMPAAQYMSPEAI